MEKFDHLKIEWEDIKLATDNFAATKLIGLGGFGSVYKGQLSRPEGLITVACKRLDRKLGQGNAEFSKEIMTLSKYKHQNLVSLLHFCIEGDERILVYEYASHGSLDTYLTHISLTWTQRLKICIGVAHALNYLHDPGEYHQRLIHRDIKSSNVLLDEEWNAKVSDFGLSKFGPANQPQTYVFTNVVGTPGYWDPLYWEECTLTKESDVYSFGVVLFEVMCGKLCCEYGDDGRLLDILVPKWKKCFEENRLDDIIKYGLRTQMEPGSLNTFSTTAYQCLKKEREARPTMGEIVRKLEMALEQQEAIEDVVKTMEFNELLRVADLGVPPLSYVNHSHLLLLFKKGTLVDNGKTWFSLNMKGQHCELISASSVSTYEAMFLVPDTNLSFGSRFSHLLNYVSNRDLRLKVTTQCLSPNVAYLINLVYKCDHPHQHDHRIPFQYKLGEMGEYLTSSVGEDKWVINFKYNMEKMRQYTTPCDADVGEDGWLRTKLFQFTSSTENQHYFDIHFCHEVRFGEHQPISIFIEGVEFCPLGLEEDENKVDTQAADVDDIDWEERLPNDFIEIVKYCEMPEKEVYSHLRKGVHINQSIIKSEPNSQQWLSISKKSKKRLMLPAREIHSKGKAVRSFLTRRKSWILKSVPGSRFQEVAEICETNHLDFNVALQSWLLSTGIMYACYLVYELPGNASMFEGRVEANFTVARFKHSVLDEPSITHIDLTGRHQFYLVAPPHTPIIEVSHGTGTDERLVRTRKIKGHPKLRRDGWMEVQVCEFLHDSHDNHVAIFFNIRSLREWNFTGLFVQGIEFRPAKVS